MFRVLVCWVYDYDVRIKKFLNQLHSLLYLNDSKVVTLVFDFVVNVIGLTYRRSDSTTVYCDDSIVFAAIALISFCLWVSVLTPSPLLLSLYCHHHRYCCLCIVTITVIVVPVLSPSPLLLFLPCTLYGCPEVTLCGWQDAKILLLTNSPGNDFA